MALFTDDAYPTQGFLHVASITVEHLDQYLVKPKLDNTVFADSLRYVVMYVHCGVA